MAGRLSTLGAMARGLAAWMARCAAWIALTLTLSLAGALGLMPLNDLSLGALLAAAAFWPMLGLGAMLAAPLALFPIGRPFFYSAAAWALLFNLFLFIA